MSLARKLQQTTADVAEINLHMNPSGGTYTSSDTITLHIYENSLTVPVNAVQANFSYPSGVLQFQAIDTSASLFTSTAQSTGGGGTVQIGVGILSSSLTGNQLVATVTFTVISTGNVPLVFTSGSAIIRASDSTDVLQQKSGANFTAS